MTQASGTPKQGTGWSDSLSHHGIVPLVMAAVPGFWVQRNAVQPKQPLIKARPPSPAKGDMTNQAKEYRIVYSTNISDDRLTCTDLSVGITMLVTPSPQQPLPQTMPIHSFLPRIYDFSIPGGSVQMAIPHEK